ncbi:MAG: Dyp-type peroxidase [Myxococcales bacterium]|nr:Dyp-type peroxidase [Myxococcales bacterium]
MLELGRIQSNILRGFRRGSDPAVEHFVFLHFGRVEGARSFVAQLLPLVTSCLDFDQGARCVLNIGLTYPAVAMFGYGGQARALDQRDHEATGTIEAFKQGMRCRAASILGDTGESAPEHWEAAYREEGPQHQLHAVLCLNARSGNEGALAETLAKVDAALVAHAGAVRRLHDEHAEAFTGAYAGTEQFGYADGIAQPAIYESYADPSESDGQPGDGTPRKRRGWDPLEPGEFVLGQIDESGQIQFRSPFFRNGSFMVFRKLRQHVGRFRDYTAAVARRKSVTAEFVGAKMIGRWPSGAPLMLAPDRDDPELGADPTRNNDFRYADDPNGLRCPLGSHIRRNNPREDPSGPGSVQTRLHRIIRRSTPYGPRLPEGQPDDGVDRGVIFVVINADIARQFEFVQQNWVQSVLSSTILTLPADRDPIIGQQLVDEDTGESQGKFLIPSSKRNQAPIIAWGLPTFVTTRGGAYFLLPSLDALWNVAYGTDCPGQSDEPAEGCPALEPSPEEPAEPEPGEPSADAVSEPSVPGAETADP